MSAKKKTWEELSPLMGVITDAELAALRGCTPAAAQRARSKRGIRSARSRALCAASEYMDPIAVSLTIEAAAAALGIANSVVSARRARIRSEFTGFVLAPAPTSVGARLGADVCATEERPLLPSEHLPDVSIGAPGATCLRIEDAHSFRPLRAHLETKTPKDFRR